MSALLFSAAIVFYFMPVLLGSLLRQKEARWWPNTIPFYVLGGSCFIGSAAATGATASQIGTLLGAIVALVVPAITAWPWSKIPAVIFAAVTLAGIIGHALLIAAFFRGGIPGGSVALGVFAEVVVIFATSYPWWNGVSERVDHRAVDCEIAQTRNLAKR